MVNTWLVGARRKVAGAGATTWWSLNGEKGVLCCANCRRNRSNRGRGDTNGLGRGPNPSLMALEHDPPLFSNHILQRIGRGGFFFSSWSLWLRAEFQIYPLTYLHCDWRVTGIILLSPISSRVRANVERMRTDMAPRTSARWRTMLTPLKTIRDDTAQYKITHERTNRAGRSAPCGMYGSIDQILDTQNTLNSSYWLKLRMGRVENPSPDFGLFVGI